MLQMELPFLLCLFISCSISYSQNVRMLTNSISSVITSTAKDGGSFNVKDYGAKANGISDDTEAFQDAWKAACSSSGAIQLTVPSGAYLVGPVEFHGPCKDVQSLTVQLEGTIKGVTDLNKYKKTTWVEFGWVDNLVLTGGGTFDGQGEVSWPFNECPKKKDCKLLPNSLTFINTKNTTLKSIKSVNPKMFHMALLGVNNFKADDITITAPKMSPNTDGIHIEGSTDVKITHSNIGTGDDCISIGQGNTQVEITNINCGPGHGISVGSLGKSKGEGDVRGLVVKDCTLTGTDNGVRIKSWENSEGTNAAANFTFDNIIMNDVFNPIIIDQTYCPYTSCDTSAPSRVRISDITFKNIRGTSKTLNAVTLDCSKSNPCKNVKFEEVNLKYVGDVAGGTANATCSNVKATYVGTQNPPPCS